MGKKHKVGAGKARLDGIKCFFIAKAATEEGTWTNTNLSWLKPPIRGVTHGARFL